MVRTLPALIGLILLAPALSSVGCKPKTPDTPTDQPATDAAANPEPAPAPEPAPVMTAEALYQECLDRVENPQKDAECTKDEDCKTAGCGNEVCTTATEAANVMTACEDKLCFKILDTCGCHEGHCNWTLKPEVPAGQMPAPGGSLPSSLPSTPPKPDGAPPTPEHEEEDDEELGD